MNFDPDRGISDPDTNMQPMDPRTNNTPSVTNTGPSQMSRHEIKDLATESRKLADRIGMSFSTSERLFHDLAAWLAAHGGCSIEEHGGCFTVTCYKISRTDDMLHWAMLRTAKEVSYAIGID